MCDVDQTRGEANAAKMGQLVFFMKADVSDYQQLVRVFEAAWARWGRLDFGEAFPLLDLSGLTCCLCSRSKRWRS